MSFINPSFVPSSSQSASPSTSSTSTGGCSLVCRTPTPRDLTHRSPIVPAAYAYAAYYTAKRNLAVAQHNKEQLLLGATRRFVARPMPDFQRAHLRNQLKDAQRPVKTPTVALTPPTVTRMQTSRLLRRNKSVGAPFSGFLLVLFNLFSYIYCRRCPVHLSEHPTRRP